MTRLIAAVIAVAATVGLFWWASWGGFNHVNPVLLFGGICLLAMIAGPAWATVAIPDGSPWYRKGGL